MPNSPRAPIPDMIPPTISFCFSWITFTGYETVSITSFASLPWQNWKLSFVKSATVRVSLSGLYKYAEATTPGSHRRRAQFAIISAR